MKNFNNILNLIVVILGLGVNLFAYSQSGNRYQSFLNNGVLFVFFLGIMMPFAIYQAVVIIVLIFKSKILRIKLIYLFALIFEIITLLLLGQYLFFGLIVFIPVNAILFKFL